MRTAPISNARRPTSRAHCLGLSAIGGATDMVPRDDRKTPHGWTVLVLAAALLSSCTEEPGPRNDSETHWLDSCLSPTQCGAPYTCHCGVCTIGCVESADCGATDPDAACFSVAQPSCQGAEAAESTGSGGYCFVDCGSDADCREWGSDLTCIGGVCLNPSGLVPPDFAPDAGDGDAAGGDATGDLASDPADTETPDTGDGCETSADCDEVQQICAGSPPTCRDRIEGDGCETDSSCPGDLYCSNGICQDGSTWDFCDTTADCLEGGDICTGSPPICSCRPCELGASCGEDTDCQPGARCSNDHCAPDGFEYVPAGSFWMGAPSGCPAPDGYPGSCEPETGWWEDQVPVHQVTLTDPFFLGTFPVTQAEYTELVGSLPEVRPCDDCPVTGLSWWHAAALANALSASQELPECYAITGCGDPIDPDECSGITVTAPEGNPYLCEGYRLPTEAEWEYAYRAGTHTPYYNGTIDDDHVWACVFDEKLDEIAWWCGNAGGMLQPTGLKAPNAWALYDMAGSATNWVWDCYDYYPVGSATNPQGPDTGESRVVRGCMYYSTADVCRAAHRAPAETFGSAGVRLARSVRTGPDP